MNNGKPLYSLITEGSPRFTVLPLYNLGVYLRLSGVILNLGTYFHSPDQGFTIEI